MQQEQSVDLQENFGRRLMNRRYDRRLLLLRLPLQHLHDLQGSRAVEPRGRLVAQQQIRIGDQLVADRSPLPLTARDALDQPAADAGVPAVLQAESLDDVLYLLLDRIARQGGPQLGSEPEGLLRRERLQQDVVLLDERAELAEVFLGDDAIVDADFTREFGAG